MKVFRGGFTGKELHVDLSAGEITEKETDLEKASYFLGGMGYGSKMLYDEVGTSIDPLGPENIIIFANGPLAGTQAPCSGRTEVTTKSPLTGHIGTGNTGGLWGTMLKRAGYDAVIVRGQARSPVCLSINEEGIELREATHLWGRDAWETSDALQKELDSSAVSVMAIGQAGENLVRYACPVNDYYHSASRSSAGAVMGAKKLKAIVVQGKKRIPIAHREAFSKAVEEARERIRNSPGIKEWGNVVSLPVAQFYEKVGCMPGRNFQTGILPQFAETRGLDAARPYLTKRAGACFGCPMPCFNLAEVKEGKYAGLKISSGTFIGAVLPWGSQCAIESLPAIWKCKELCHRFGMDFFSAAGTIAFAMELYQRGILSKKETDGLELNWGDDDAVIQMLHKIALRNGLGNILADGCVRAARQIGRGADRYAMTIKNMEISLTDPRAGTKGWVFGFVTNPRGGDNVKTTHTRADRIEVDCFDDLDIFPSVKEQIYGKPPRSTPFSWEGKLALAKWFEDLCSAVNALGICIFPVTSALALGPTHLSKLLSACTGWDLTPADLLRIGERIFNLQRTYLVREGLTRKDDLFPERFYTEPLPEGPSQGNILSKEGFEHLLDEYYELRGWNQETGCPSKEKLLELELNGVVTELERLGKL